ncbi:MAG: VOC family protein [Acidobacteriia bacterium]|nr:VOC family protein [Terriglobia bacterium]
MAIIDEKAGTIPDNKILLREIVHACVVVRNVEKTARNLSDKFGIGPWDVHVKSYPESQASFRGKSTDCTFKFAYARVGTITLELVEPISGMSSYQEFLEQHGEGLHHLGFPVPLPFDAEIEKWKRQGLQPVQVMKLDDPEEGWAYMDTQDLAGFTLEILSFRKFQ